MSSSPPNINGFLSSIGKVPAFPAPSIVTDLQAASLTLSNMTEITKYFAKPVSSQTNCTWDGIDCSSRVQVLAAASAAAIVPNINDNGKGFAALVNQAPANQVPKDKLQALITPIFASRINTQITADGFPNLATLYANSAFTKAYFSTVNSPFFDPFQDQPDDTYALNVLFVYEYFSKGPDFTMPQDITQTASLTALQAWVSNMKLSTMSTDQLTALAKSCGVAMSGVFSATGTADAQLGDYVASLAAQKVLFSTTASAAEVDDPNSNISQVIAEAASKTLFDNATLKAYEQATSYQLWYQWNLNLSTVDGFWQAGVTAAEDDPVVLGTTSFPGGYTETIDYGANLVQWAKTNGSQDFINPNAKVNNISTQSHSIISGGCFSAGTQILTDQGPKSIESLTEGQMILTRAEPQHYGVASDEKVISSSPEHLYGFNGEKEFFSPGHVFFTTTGLRALVPEIARVENPWLDVGQLQVGHVLLQTDDGKSYRTVQIKSIRGKPYHEKYIYGVHLREGLRSYHANGYLVALNYPEITVSSIAGQLQEIPQAQRLRILSQCADVLPYLRRFGGQTVLEAIQRESQFRNPLYGGKVQPTSGFCARGLVMPYLLYCKDSMKCLAKVELYSGVLHLDSKLCEQARFDQSSLRWSRQLDSGEWEHAFCTFLEKGFRAEGRLIRSTKKNPTQEEIAKNFTRFQMVPGVLANHSQPKKTHFAVKSEAMKQLLQANAAPKLWSWDILYDPAAFVLSTDTSQWKPTISCGSVTMQIVHSTADYDSLTIDLYDQVSDAMIANAKKSLPTPDAQSLMDQMQKLYEHDVSSSPNSQIYHTFNVLYANKILQASDEYAAWLKQNPDFLDTNSQPPNKNLHYTGIGMDASFVIPVLFQSMKLTTTPDGSTISGVLTEFDSYATGRAGTPHWVSGQSNSSLEVTLSAAQAEATHRADTRGLSKLVAHSEPQHETIERLASPALNNSDDLMNAIIGISYDQNTVNNDVQTLFRNVMAWHMDPSERTLFLGTEQPTGLPAEFTTALAGSDTAKWLANTYARAYICQVLAQDDSQISSPYRFTAQEIKNINYFWTGQGASCLAKSSIYQALERNLTRYQIRQNYPPIQTAYDSNGGSGGQPMSNKLLAYYTGNPFGLGTFGTAFSDGKATTALTKVTAIMDALDNGAPQTYTRKIWTASNNKQSVTVTDTNSNQLVFFILGRKHWPLHHAPYWGNPKATDALAAGTLGDQWLDDAMSDIVTRLLANDPSITSPTLIQMSKEIQQWGSQITGWDSMKPKDQQLLVVSSFGGRIRATMAGLAITFGWVKSGAGWVISKGKVVVASWKGGSERIGDVVEDAINDTSEPPPPNLPGLPAALGKGLLFVVGAAALGASIWMLKDTWAGASVAKRGQLITGVIGSFNNLANLGIDAIETIMRRSGGVLDPAQQSISARFDQEFGQYLQSDESVLDVNPDTGVGVAPGELRGENSLIEELNLQSQEALESEWETILANKQEAFQAALDAATQAGETASSIETAFSAVRGVLDAIGYLVAIGVAIFMTWQLVENWSTMSGGDRAFAIIQDALAVVAGIGAAVMVGIGAAAYIATVAVSVGWAAGSAFAVSATAAFFAGAALFASVTAVLAIIGVLVLVAYFIWEYTKPPQPNPVETWMQNEGHKWAGGIPAPSMPTVFSMTQTYKMNPSTVQEIQMTFQNNTASDITNLFALEVGFTSGPTVASLFNDGVKFAVGSSSQTAGNCRLVSSAANTTAQLNIINHMTTSGNKDDTKLDVADVSFQITGPTVVDPDTGLATPTLTVRANETLTLYASGVIYTDQKVNGGVPTCYVTQTQVPNGDWLSDNIAITRQ